MIWDVGVLTYLNRRFLGHRRRSVQAEEYGRSKTGRHEPSDEYVLLCVREREHRVRRK